MDRLFSDETNFCLGGDNQWICVRRHSVQHQDKHFVVMQHTFRKPGVIAWGTLLYDTRSPFMFITGILTAQHYVNDQWPYLFWMYTTMYTTFQQGNADLHTAVISRACNKDKYYMPWPVMSPDLSPIVNGWDAIGCAVNTPPLQRNLWEYLSCMGCIIARHH